MCDCVIDVNCFMCKCSARKIALFEGAGLCFVCVYSDSPSVGPSVEVVECCLDMFN